MTINYLNKQLKKYKSNSSISLKKAQAFAIEQDLTTYDLGSLDNQEKSFYKKGVSKSESFLPFSNVGIENVRVDAANQIRKIDKQLEKIYELQDSEELQYIGSTIPALVEEELPQLLKDIESQLVDFRSRYTDDDENIIRLIEKRKITADFLKDRAIKYLKVARLEQEAIMEAAMRPKGVILKYKELIRDAARDERILVSLEDQLRMSELEAAKTEDPWQLITMPTLKANSVAPSKSRIGIFGLFIGAILGTVIAFYKEKKSDKIYEPEILEKLLNAPIIEKFSSNTITSGSDELMFLSKFFRLQSNENLELIYQSDSEQNIVERFKETLLKNNQLKINLITTKLSNIEIGDNSNRLFLICEFKKCNYQKIKNLRKIIRLLNLNIEGIILLV